MAIRKIADTVLPNSIDLSSIVQNFKHGYNKGTAVEWVVDECTKKPFLTRVNLLSIYLQLETLWRNGEFV